MEQKNFHLNKWKKQHGADSTLRTLTGPLKRNYLDTRKHLYLLRKNYYRVMNKVAIHHPKVILQFTDQTVLLSHRPRTGSPKVPTIAFTTLRNHSLAILCMACTGQSGYVALAQVPMSQNFAGGNPAPSNAPLPNAPDAPISHAVMRGAIPPGDQPLVLPRNFRIAPASMQSDLPSKLSYGFGSLFSVRDLIEPLLIAGVPNLTTPPQRPTDALLGGHPWDVYTDEMQVWGSQNETTIRYHLRRAEVGLATVETRQLTSNLVLPLLLHQQAQFIPAPSSATFGEHMMNAATSIVLTRSDTGAVVPNYSKLGGTVLAGFLAKSFYAKELQAPELGTTHFAMKYIGYSLAGDLATNTVHEMIRAARQPETQMYEIHGRATEDSYYPLSMGGKTMYWLHSTYSPRNFFTGLVLASNPSVPSMPKDPVPNDPKTWDKQPTYVDAFNYYGPAMFTWKETVETKARQFGRRFGGGLSEVESQDLLQNFLIPIAFNMDPRYIPYGDGHTAGERFGHAFTSLVVGHNDDGKQTINLPVLGGTAGAAVLAQQVYYPALGVPQMGSNSLLIRTIGFNLLADGILNTFSEFFGHRTY